MPTAEPRGPLDPETLVERYGERIYRVARRLVANDADAEDVTQTVLLKLLEHGATFRGESDPMGFVYRIAVNESREVQRRRGRRPTVSLDAQPGALDAPADRGRKPDTHALRAEVERTVHAAIQELPDGYRETVVLMDLEGLSYKDAAEVLGLTLAGFKTRLHRARLHLRRRLAEQGRTPRGPSSGTGGA